MNTNLPKAISNTADLQAALSNVLDTVEVSGGGQYLKMTKAGMWIYGADEIEVEEDSQWAINPMSIKMGYVCWHQSKLVGEQLRPFYQPAILQSDLPAMPAAWKQQISIDLMCMTGEDEGTTVSYPVSSNGGLKALRDIIAKIRTQIESGKIVPFVTLANDSYKHAEYGKIYNPVINVVKWTTMDTLPGADAVEEPAEVEEAPVVIEAPVKAARKQKAAEPVEDAEVEAVEDDKPAVRQRRRRA